VYVELARVVALVAHGNAVLGGLADPSGLEDRIGVFDGSEPPTFEVPDAAGGRVLATSIEEWLGAASRWGVGRLSFLGGGSAFPAGGSAPGFTGVRDGAWGILGHGPDRAFAWYPAGEIDDTVTGVQAPLSPAGEAGFRMLVRHEPITPAVVDLDARRRELLGAMAAAQEFAAEHPYTLGTFARWFEVALEAAARPEEPIPGGLDLFPSKGYPAEARRLLSLAVDGWVFGGMGSWTDAGFADPDTDARYRAVSDRLYRALIDAVGEAANAFDPGSIGTE
jgi:hypothetical protein